MLFTPLTFVKLEHISTFKISKVTKTQLSFLFDNFNVLFKNAVNLLTRENSIFTAIKNTEITDAENSSLPVAASINSELI